MNVIRYEAALRILVALVSNAGATSPEGKESYARQAFEFADAFIRVSKELEP